MLKRIDSHPSLTPEHIREMRRLADRIDREEKDEIVARGREYFDELAEREELVRSLIARRIGQRLSLADVADRMDVHPNDVLRFEDSQDSNPTLEMLQKYARAVRARCDIGLIELEGSADGVASSTVGRGHEAA